MAGQKCLWLSHCFSLLPPHPREAIASFTMVPTPLLMSLFNRNSLSSPNCLLNLKGWLCCVVPLEPTKSQLLNALGAQITGVFWYPEECLLCSCIRGKQKQQQKHEQCHSQARRVAADRILVFAEGWWWRVWWEGEYGKFIAVGREIGKETSPEQKQWGSRHKIKLWSGLLDALRLGGWLALIESPFL